MRRPIRQDLRGIFDAAVRRVNGKEAARRALSTAALPVNGRIWILGAGKASGAMALGAYQALGDRIAGGLVIVSDGNTRRIPGVEVVEAGHPVPDRRGLQATERLLQIADQAGPDDTVIWLVSGGGSSLLVAPKPGISMQDVTSLNHRLLTAGTPISELNKARVALSRVKGGGLEDRISPANLISLAISDVPGDDPTLIASGPTRSIQVIATLEDALQAAAEHGRQLGYRVTIEPIRLEGEASEVGPRLAKTHLNPGECRIWGGETTVEVTGGGRGGRSQELALSAALCFEDDRAMLSAGTDGVDGPTDAAGAIVDRETPKPSDSARRHLEDNDAWTFLDAAGALVRTGPTGTNVADIVLLARPNEGPK